MVVLSPNDSAWFVSRDCHIGLFITNILISIPYSYQPTKVANMVPMVHGSNGPRIGRTLWLSTSLGLLRENVMAMRQQRCSCNRWCPFTIPLNQCLWIFFEKNRWRELREFTEAGHTFKAQLGVPCVLSISFVDVVNSNFQI